MNYLLTLSQGQKRRYYTFHTLDEAQHAHDKYQSLGWSAFIYPILPLTQGKKHYLARKLSPIDPRP